MVRLAWWIVTVALVLVLPHAEAQATCGVECQLTPVIESCEVPAMVDCTDCGNSSAYEWRMLDRITFTAACSEQCCSELGCGAPEPVEIDLGYFRVSDDATHDALDFTSTLEETCGGLVVMEAQLVAGRAYNVIAEDIVRFKLVVAEDAVEVDEGEDDTSAGDTSAGDTSAGDTGAGNTGTGDTGEANVVEDDTGCRQAGSPGPWGLGALLLGLGLTATARVRRRA